jgi:hypothetical protein
MVSYKRMIKKIVKILGLNVLFSSLERFLPLILFTVLINIIPLIGVFVFGWNAFDFIVIYWIENTILLIFSLINRQGKIDQERGFMLFSEKFTRYFYYIIFLIFHILYLVFILVFFLKNTTFISNSFLVGLMPYIVANILIYGLYFFNLERKRKSTGIENTSLQVPLMIRTFVLGFPIFYGFAFIEIGIGGRIVVVIFVLIKSWIDYQSIKYGYQAQSGIT